MNGWAFGVGMIVLGVFIDHGLVAIANAILRHGDTRK
jgi:hypothetical protein